MGMGNLGTMRALSSSSSSSSSSSATIITAAFIMVMLCLGVPKVSSSGYERVATVYLDQATGEWRASCFLKNTATLRVEADFIHSGAYFSVAVVPHHGKCWTCRDDYQMKLGDRIMATGSTYFGSVSYEFPLKHSRADIPKIKSQGIDIYVDMNAACNALPKEAMKNPFKRAKVSVAMD